MKEELEKYIEKLKAYVAEESQALPEKCSTLLSVAGDLEQILKSDDASTQDAGKPENPPPTPPGGK